MATDLERLVVSLEANVKKFETELRRGRKTTEDELDGIEKKFSSTGKGVAAATSNIAAQFQDIAVSFQGGQNPFTVALQQGTQISAVLGQRGAAGAAELFKGAIQSVASPLSLATIGIIALGGVAFEYFSKIGGDVKTLDDLLDEHDKTIKALVESYGSVGKGIDTSPIKESTAVAESLVRENVRALQKEYKGLSDSIVASLTVYTQLGDAAGIFTEETAPKFKTFAAAIDAFRESARNGAPDVRALRTAISEIERTTTDAKVRQLANELLTLTGKAGDADTALRSIERTVGALGQAVGGQAEQFKKFGEAIAELSKMSLPKLDDRGKVQEAYNRALENATGIEERRAAAAARDGALRKISNDEAKKAAEDAERDAARAASRAASKAASDKKSFENSQENVRKSTEMLQLEFDLVGKTAQERDKARMTIELESAARKTNQLEIAGTKEKIDELATAYAAAAERARQANGPLGAFARSAADTGRNLQEAAVSGLHSLEDAFLGIINGSVSAKDAFKTMADAIIADLARIAIRQAITGPIASALGGAFSGGGELPGFGTSSFVGPLPGRASGGPVNAGQAYMVGETGREMFVPNQNGMIIPSSRSGSKGGGGVTVNLIEDASRAGQTKKSDNGSGGFDLTVYVDSITAKNAANPGSATSQVLAQRGRLASR
jgi:hypothetical protein